MMSYLIQLKSFLVVYRLGTFSKAAENIGISQPAVTSHIKALESTLNSLLFVRRSHGVEPTSDADYLARQIGTNLDSVERIINIMRLNAKLTSGTVNFIGPSEYLSENASTIFDYDNSKLKLRVLTGNKDKIITSLKERKSDIAITTTLPESVDFDYQVIDYEELILIASKKMHDSIKGKKVSKDILFKFPVISYDNHLPLIRNAIGLNSTDIEKILALITVPDLRVLKNILKSRAAWSVLPDYLCDKELQDRELFAIDNDFIKIKNEIYCVWSKNAIKKGQVYLFKEHILSHAKKNSGSIL